MGKTKLIIWREFITRVRKPSFVLMSILGPLLIAGSIMLLVYLSLSESTEHIVYVEDGPGILSNQLKNKDKLTFVYGDFEELSDSAFVAGRYTLRARVYPELNEPIVHLHFKEPPGEFVQRHIEREVERAFEEAKIAKSGITPEIYANIKKPIKITTFDIEDADTESNTKALSVIGFFMGYLMFFFVFMYAVQVMRGVMEEKSNRIVEVLISSIRPFQLMMGKIIGIAMVGFTQFMIWVGLTTVIAVVGIGVFLSSDAYDPAAIAEQVQMTTEMQEQIAASGANLPSSDLDELVAIWGQINIPLVLALFLFYFITGYFLYSALFAAVGSAVDNEADTQQFMMPLMIPLVAGIFIAQMAMTNPSSPVVEWGSIIPFTAPVVMMARLVLGDVTTWQLILSMIMMIVGFVGTTWIAGKIYRVGILMYGKKVNYKELFKWIRYS